MKRLTLGLLALGFGLALAGAPAHTQGLAAVISVDPASHDFGTVPVSAVATASLMVSNTGNAPLVVSAVKTKAPFGDNATSFTIQPGQSRRVDILFAPQSPGVYNDNCTFQSNASNGALFHVPLSGTGQ